MNYVDKLNIIAIVQARLGSTRLPKKVLVDIDGRTMIEYIIGRLKSSKIINKVVVTTTTDSSDDLLVDYLREKNISCFRGRTNDIVQRFYEAGVEFNADIVVRIWGDCPLIDAVVIETMLNEHHRQHADYTSNVDYPFGMDAEIYSIKTLKYLFDNVNDPFYREFPFEYIKDSNVFKAVKVSYGRSASNINLTMDYPQDLDIIRKIIDHFSKNQLPLELDNIVDFCRNNKEIFAAASDLSRNIEYHQSLRRHNETRR
ncbi:MAG: NTP transferase domain-containing protein [Candidatus Omnitrophota bacterium]